MEHGLRNKKELTQDQIEYRKKYNRDRYKVKKDKILKLNEEWRSRNIEYLIWHRAKMRSKRSGLSFNIEVSDIIIPNMCPLLNTPIIWSGGEDSPALDRIDNTLGYIKGNVWIISHLANRMKNSATIDELNHFSKNWKIMMETRPDLDDRYKGDRNDIQ